MTEPLTPPEGRPKRKTTFGAVIGWNKLKEMRTVFQLLVVIAIAALFCAIIPQNEDPQLYYERYGRFVANIIVWLGLDHVHNVLWFELLIGLLMLSLVACSGRLWQEARLRWRLPTADGASQKLGAATLSAVSPHAPEAAVAVAIPALRKHGYRVLDLGGAGQQRLLYAHKHRWSAWGQALAHYSVFLIALGSVMGAMHGLSVDQNVTIAEGETFRSEDGSVPFGIKVDRFTIAQDPANGSVKNYYSDVRIMAGDQEALRATISVNHPLRYRGYFISQSDWGLGEAKIEISRGEKTGQYAFPLQRSVYPGMDEAQSMWGVPEEAAALRLPDEHAALVVTGFFADAVRQDGKILQRDAEYPGTPALNLTYVTKLPGNRPQGPAQGMAGHDIKELGWLLPGESVALAGGAAVKFVGITKATGLGIRKDVGLPFVWIGFCATMVGLIMIFYFPLQRCVLGFEAHGEAQTVITMSRYGRTADLGDDSDDLWRGVLERVGGKPAAKAGVGESERPAGFWRRLSIALPPLEQIDRSLYRAVAFGVPLLTMVIITGAVWAQYVWQRWWSWDPKETASLVTWLIYAGYLHGRRQSKWTGKTSATIVLVGFLAVLFTFAGVNFLQSMHSYGMARPSPTGRLLGGFSDVGPVEAIATTGFFLCYLAGLITVVAGAVGGSLKASKLSFGFAAAGFAGNTLILILRAIAAHRLTFTSGYDFSLWFVWGIMLWGLLAYLSKQRFALMGTLPIALLVSMYGYLYFPQKGHMPLPPALQNKLWLHIHVALAIFAYGALSLAAGWSLLYLVKYAATGAGRQAHKAAPAE